MSLLGPCCKSLASSGPPCATDTSDLGPQHRGQVFCWQVCPVPASTGSCHEPGERAHQASWQGCRNRVVSLRGCSLAQYFPALCPGRKGLLARQPGEASGAFLLPTSWLVQYQCNRDPCPWTPSGLASHRHCPGKQEEKKGFRKRGKNRDLYLGLIFLPGKDPCQQGDYNLGYTEILPDLQCL